MPSALQQLARQHIHAAAVSLCQEVELCRHTHTSFTHAAMHHSAHQCLEAFFWFTNTAQCAVHALGACQPLSVSTVAV
jgi:hypothetical protein